MKRYRGALLLLMLLTAPFSLVLPAWQPALSQEEVSKKQPSPLAISGWPLLPIEPKAPPLWLGDDPVLGRLICPPLSRLNLLTRQSEVLIFSEVGVKDEPSGRSLWSYTLRPGIYWWGGQEVRSEEIAAFLSQQLPKVVAEKGSGLWPLPAFNVSAQARQVLIHWQEKPRFGPFIFNGLPFWRLPSPDKREKEGAYDFECAGVYRPKRGQKGLFLLPTPGYTMPREPLYLSEDAAGAQQVGSKGVFTFKMADTFAVDPAVRPPHLPAPCPQAVELPYVSAIVWNLTRPQLKEARLRQVLTALIPRGALLRAGAGFAGELLASPLPRNHPGYGSQNIVRPFNLEKSAQELSRLGYSRPQGDQSRRDKTNQPLQLSLVASTSQPGLVEKVFADSFMAVGIDVRFVDPASKFDLKELDGVVTGVYLPWPEMNFLPYFHSQAAAKYPFWPLQEKSLDLLLEGYGLSLTQEKPDFSKLQAIHAKLYELEPMTIIMQHKACLHTPASKAISRIDVRDPDWFRRLIL